MADVLSNYEEYVHAQAVERANQSRVRSERAPFNKALVGYLLRNGHLMDWSIQGLGMLRLYLDREKTYRLHIWDAAFRVDGVSALHTHPWDMESTIIAGEVHQRRYRIEDPARSLTSLYNQVRIECGPNAHMTAKPTKVNLWAGYRETYTEGEVYTQSKSEIHESFPADGTVTIVKRIPFGDPDHADVFWRGGPFVDAAPRQATADEVARGIESALRWWR